MNQLSWALTLVVLGLMVSPRVSLALAPTGDSLAARQDEENQGAGQARQQVTSAVVKTKERELVAEIGRKEYDRQLNLVRTVFAQRFRTGDQELLAFRPTLPDYKFGVPPWYIGTKDGQTIAWIAVLGEQTDLYGWSEAGKWVGSEQFQAVLAAVALSQMERAATKELVAARVAVQKKEEKVQNATRTWRSSDGPFSVAARFVKRAGDVITLERADGTTIDVDINDLSQNDRDFLKDRH